MNRSLLTLSVILASSACVQFTGGDDDDAAGNEKPIAVVDVVAEAELLSTIPLSGVGSHDPDASAGSGIAEYQWEIIERPEGSNAQILDPGAAVTELFADFAGTFRGELVVLDDDGLASDPASFEFNVLAPEDVSIELAWDTSGTDLDLHVVSVELTTAGGTGFNVAPADCDYANLMPDWPPLGSSDGDCDFGVDDVDGFGPETADIPGPPPAYRVFAGYRSANGMGNTTATVRVYLGGTLIFEDLKVLNENEAWIAGETTNSGNFVVDGTTFTY